jgi:hypothetical protein
VSEPKTYTAEAVIDLPAPLLLGPEFLGLLKPAVVGGVEVHVVLPDFKVGETGFETVLHPRARVDWLGSFAKKESEDDRESPFGGVTSWQGTGKVLQFSATRLLVLPRSRVTRRSARSLHRAADDWVQLLEMWIEVVAREDLHQERVRVENPGRSAYVWLSKGKKQGGVLKTEPLIVINLGGPLTIIPRQWGRMLMKASEGAQPPEAHLFLRDARNARNSGRYRRSVLDSATAAELGLAKLRDDDLAGSGALLQKYVQGKAQQISRLSEFLSTMGNELPEKIQQEIGEPRNKAMHEGHEPDEETATKALDKAEQVVDLAFPWRKLL